MQDVVELEELDLRVLNALQLRPRASWTLIGSVVGAHAVTVERRWTRLRAAGRAWIACQPGAVAYERIALGFVELDCESGRALDVAERLAGVGHVVAIEHTTGGRDLFLNVMCPDMATLAQYLLNDLRAVPGIRAARTQIATHVYVEGSRWRLRALDARQRAALKQPEPSSSPAVRAVEPADRALLALLAEDGRRSYAELAAVLGVSVSTVRRRLTGLVNGRHVQLRCEISRPLTGWPVSAQLWAHVPPETLDRTAQLVAALPEVRLCAGVTGGAANLLVSAWLRSVAQVQQLEIALSRRIPELRVVDRAVALRHLKRMGHVLDSAERSTGVVPPDYLAAAG
jgi:DNA-binding Lrp family transcriptional regulator